MNPIVQFICGNHSFTVCAAESGMVYTVTLIVAAECGRGAEIVSQGVSVYEITQGDYVWNTLVADREQNGVLDLAACIPYLRACAEEFTREHPEPLRFSSRKKAARFAADTLRCPVNLRGNPYRVHYPGATAPPCATLR